MTATARRASVAAMACLVTCVAYAQDISDWVRDTHSGVRLLAGSRSGAVLLGGIAFDLKPGWKTYWRTPGDSGMPAQFDFAASENVDSVTVLWPAPIRFPDGSGGYSYGYKDAVILPLRINAKQADKPVKLRAKIAYAVCEKLCVPVEAQVELPFDNVASTQDGVLAAALDTVPKPANVGDQHPFSIVAVRREGNKRVVVDVRPADGVPAELFVEGPTPDWALPSPELQPGSNDGLLRFAFDLDGLPTDANPSGAILKMTLVSGTKSYEFNATLD